MSTEGETLRVSVLPYKCSICPRLVTRQMSNLAILVNSKTQNGFFFFFHAMFCHDCPLAIKPASTPQRLVHKKTWRDSVLVYMLLSAVSVLVVAQRSSEVPEGLMNNPVLHLYGNMWIRNYFLWTQHFEGRRVCNQTV
jgi:hypothetical protein